MKTKKIFLSLAASMLLGFGSIANATLLSSFQYTGNVTVTGFAGTDTTSYILGDNNNQTLRFTWEITAGSHSVTHAMGIPTTVAGSGTIFDNTALGDIAMGTDFLAPFAELMPEGPATFPFPTLSTGDLDGTPLFSTSLFKFIPNPFGPDVTVDSILEINHLNFTNNIITMDLFENVQTGGTSFGNLLAFASPDGVFQRDFQLSGEVSAVPVPAAVWLFGSALLGLAGTRRKLA